MKKLLITLLVISVMIPGMSFAHEPRIPEGNSTIVSAPEISKAYYSQLS